MLSRALPLVAVLAAACTSALHAQERFYDSWRWVTYGVDAGLDGRVFNLREDENGVVWALRRTGLSWFDGYEWIGFGAGRGLPEEGLAHMELRGHGGVIVVTGDRVFGGDRLGFEEVPLGLPDGVAVWHAVGLGRGDVLAATSEGLVRWRAEGGVEDVALPSTLDPTLRFTRLPSGRVFATDQSGVYEWVGQWQTHLQLNRPHFVRVDEHGGDVFVAEESNARRGVWRIPARGQPSFLPSGLTAPINGFSIGPAGVPTLLSAFSRVVLHDGTAWMEIDPTPEGLAGAGGIKYASNGDLWVIGPRGVAVNLSGPDRWLRWTTPAASVNALHFASDDRVWIGTGSGGLVVREPDGGHDVISRIGEDTLSVVTGIAEDPDGGIWVTSGSGFRGAYRLLDGVWTHFGSEEGLGDEYFHDVAPDANGDLWFLAITPPPIRGARGATVYRYVDGAFRHWPPADELPAARLYAFDTTDEGHVWFGTFEGLSCWDGESWRHWSLADGLRAPKVFTVNVADDGTVWFGHQDEGTGLGRLDPERDVITYLDGEDGLPNAGVWSIETDDRGAVWVSTRAGLGLVTPEGITVSIGEPEGLRFPFVWPMVARGDSLHLGTVGAGVMTYVLGRLPDRAPRIRLEPLGIDGDRLTASWRVLPYPGDQEPSRAKTRYRLDGGAWTEWGTERVARLAGLSWGTHDLEVQSSTLTGRATRAETFELAVPNPLARSELARWFVAFWLVTAFVGLVAFARRNRSHLSELEERERYFRSLIENASDVIWVLGEGGRVEYVSPSVTTALGASSDAARSRPIVDAVVAEDRPRLEAAIAKAAEHPDQAVPTTARFIHADDIDPRPLELVVRRGHDADGRPITVLNGRDRSEHERSEALLRQASKMEAVGQLTGGVAHDFNNLLTVIIGELEFASYDGERRDLRLAREAAERASELTSRLLSFSRKQALRPRALDLNEVLEGLVALLRRTLGGTVDVAIRTQGAPIVVEIDPSQLESALLNLAINARDAMDGDGHLTISVDTTELRADDLVLDTTVRPGAYAVLSVEDDGSGIPDELLPQVFDPFFTTKGVGEGSGLGLSMVYGFVKQSDGYVTIDSRVGSGTTIRIYLPLVGRPT